MSPGIPSILIAVVLALPLLSSDAMTAQGKGPEKMELFAARTLKDLRAPCSGLGLAWARSTADRRRAVIEFRYTDNQRNPMRGRYYFNTQYPDATVFGYEASEKEFGKQKSLLLSVLANFTILDPSAASGQPGASSPRNTATDLQMTKTVPGDRSFSLLVPKGWKLEGAKGQARGTTPGHGLAGVLPSPIFFRGT